MRDAVQLVEGGRDRGELDPADCAPIKAGELSEAFLAQLLPGAEVAKAAADRAALVEELVGGEWREGRHSSDADRLVITNLYMISVKLFELFDRIRHATTRARVGHEPEHHLSTYTLTAPGLVEPTEYDTLPEATAALTELLESLALSPARRDAYLFFLQDVARPADFIERDGHLTLPFAIAGRQYAAVITLS